MDYFLETRASQSYVSKTNHQKKTFRLKYALQKRTRSHLSMLTHWNDASDQMHHLVNGCLTDRRGPPVWFISLLRACQDREHGESGDDLPVPHETILNARTIHVLRGNPWSESFWLSRALAMADRASVMEGAFLIAAPRPNWRGKWVHGVMGVLTEKDRGKELLCLARI